MKKGSNKSSEMRLEYDFTTMKGGVPGKYAKPFRPGMNLVLLDPDVYKAFPTAGAVNQTLRTVLEMTKIVRSTLRRKLR